MSMTHEQFQHRARLIEQARRDPAAIVDVLLATMIRETKYEELITEMTAIVAQQDALLSLVTFVKMR